MNNMQYNPDNKRLRAIILALHQHFPDRYPMNQLPKYSESTLATIKHNACKWKISLQESTTIYDQVILFYYSVPQTQQIRFVL